MSSNVDVFKNVKILFFISKLWGLVPLSDESTIKNVLFISYSFLVIIFYLYVCVSYNLSVYSQIDQAAANVKLLAKIIYVKNTLQCILLVAVLAVHMTKGKRLFRMLQRIENFDTLFKKKCNVQVPMKSNFQFQVAYSMYIVFFGIYHSIQLYLDKSSVITSVQWSVLTNVNLIITAQFTIFIHALDSRFKVFNGFFASLNSYPKFNISIIRSSFAFSSPASYPSRYRNFHVLNQFRLKELHVIYLSLRDILYEINSYYSFQTLFIVCETSTVLVASISSITFNITSDFFAESVQRNLTLLYCCCRLFTVTVLIYVAEKTSNQVISVPNFAY